MNREYDNGTRAFIWNAFNDVFYCLISPGVVFYGAPSVRGRVRRLCSSLRRPGLTVLGLNQNTPQ